MRKLVLAILLVAMTCGYSFASEVDELRSHMVSRTDEIQGIRWINDRATRTGASRRFYVYLGAQGTTVWPRLRVGFVSRSGNLVGFDRMIINVDGDVYTLNFAFRDTQSEVLRGGGFDEWADVNSGEYGDLITRIARSQRTLVRFSGRTRQYDMEITQAQKDALGRVWRLYELRNQWAQ